MMSFKNSHQSAHQSQHIPAPRPKSIPAPSPRPLPKIIYFVPVFILVILLVCAVQVNMFASQPDHSQDPQHPQHPATTQDPQDHPATTQDPQDHPQQSSVSPDSIIPQKEPVDDLETSSKPEGRITISQKDGIVTVTNNTDDSMLFSVFWGRERVIIKEVVKSQIKFKIENGNYKVYGKFPDALVCRDLKVVDSNYKACKSNSYYVDYTEDSDCVKKAASLKKQSKSTSEFIESCCKFVAKKYTYKSKFNNNECSEHVADLDKSYVSGVGNCQVYASTLCAMFRSQGIKARYRRYDRVVASHVICQIKLKKTVKIFDGYEIKAGVWVDVSDAAQIVSHSYEEGIVASDSCWVLALSEDSLSEYTSSGNCDRACICNIK